MDTDLQTAEVHVVWPTAFPASCVTVPPQWNLNQDTKVQSLAKVSCFFPFRQETRKELLNHLLSKFLLTLLLILMCVVPSIMF